jgi:hypothetical protein
MTISRLLRRFAGSAYCAALALPTLGCSDDKPTETPDPEMLDTATACAEPATVIGAFQASLEAANSSTEVIGQVRNAPPPPNIVWTDAQEEGDCRLQEPSAPFCDPGCGGDVCVEGNTCVPHAEGHSVGAVTVSGVELESGETRLVLKETNTSYQAPPNTAYAFPPFTEGELVKVQAAGGDYPGFKLVAHAVAPLSLTSDDFEIAENKAFALTWGAAKNPAQSRVQLELDISSHGGTRGRIVCDTDDDGELTISGEMMTALIGLGVAGFPTVELRRVSTGGADIPQGCVELRVSSFVGQAVTVAGVTSCTDTTCSAGSSGCVPCPDDMTCRSDLVCE